MTGFCLVLSKSDGGREGRWLAAVLACAALLLVACTAGGDPGPPPAVTSAPGPDPSAGVSLSPAQAAERDALAAYRGMWEDWVALAASGDYQDPRLADHTSGEALETIYEAVYLDQGGGRRARGEPVLAPVVTSAEPAEDPTRVVVEDCVDDSDWLTYLPDGRLADDEPGGRRRTEALVVSGGDGWKVDKFVVQTVGTC